MIIFKKTPFALSMLKRRFNEKKDRRNHDLRIDDRQFPAPYLSGYCRNTERDSRAAKIRSMDPGNASIQRSLMGRSGRSRHCRLSEHTQAVHKKLTSKAASQGSTTT
jgi:hypothetical protein